MKQQEIARLTKKERLGGAVGRFAENGYLKSSIKDITGQAGYAPGNFYRYWKSKDDMLLEIMETRFISYREKRDQSIKQVENLEQVLNVIFDFLETIIDDKNWSKVFLEFTVYASGKNALREKLNNNNYRLSNSLFADIVRPFIPEDVNPEKMGALNTALFEGFLIHNILGTQVLDKQDFREAALKLALQTGAGK